MRKTPGVFGVLKKSSVNRWARLTGFVKRKGILKPYEFLVLLVVGQMGMKHPSLAGMVAAIRARITREALHQRFNKTASAFLRRCLRFVLRQKFLSVSIRTSLLRPFRRVLLVDSSSWDVNEELRGVLPGSGGDASSASCKIQVAYEYKKGELVFVDQTAGTVPDNRYTDNLPALVRKRDLLLFDQGYFKLKTFIAIAAKGAYFLTRFLMGTTLRDAGTGVLIKREKELAKWRGNTYERLVTMGGKGAQTGPCRLICLRASKHVANARRRQLRKQARKKGRTVSRLHLSMCNWTIFVTNVPEKWLPVEMVRALYTLRWQIELLFKQLKSILRVHESNTGNEHRLRCELYGKLIAAVLVHRLHAAALWNSKGREISMDKLYKRIQERSFSLAQRFIASFTQAISYLYQELDDLLQHCMKGKQVSRMTTLEMLEAGIDPRLKTQES